MQINMVYLLRVLALNRGRGASTVDAAWKYGLYGIARARAGQRASVPELYVARLNSSCCETRSRCPSNSKFAGVSPGKPESKSER